MARAKVASKERDPETIVKQDAVKRKKPLPRFHEDFQQRLEQASDVLALVPPQNYGRLNWFVEQFQTRFQQQIAGETVRKWFAGEAKPRDLTMTRLATILNVDPAWLSLGAAPEMSMKEQKLRNASADGVVNLVAGWVQMQGGTPAFPDGDDKRAGKAQIDLYAILRGASYSIHVSLGTKKADEWHFAVPVNSIDEAIVLGVIPREGFSVRILEIDSENIRELGKPKGAYVELVMSDELKTGEHTWREVKTFAERL